MAWEHDLPVEVCLQMDNAARHTIDRWSGRELSKDETLEILRKSEESGLVHIKMNKVYTSHFIRDCRDCRDCCCQTLPLTIFEKLNLTDPDKYEAVISKDKRAACGNCLYCCYLNVIEEISENGSNYMKVTKENQFELTKIV